MEINTPTEKLFAEVISKRAWYKPLGVTAGSGSTYKMRFENGKLTEGTMIKILERLGYEKVITWKKKKQ